MSEKKHVMTIAEMLEGVQTDTELTASSEQDGVEDTAPIDIPTDAVSEAQGDVPTEEFVGADEETPVVEEHEDSFRTRPWIMPEPPEPPVVPSEEEETDSVPLTVPSSVAEESETDEQDETENIATVPGTEDVDDENETEADRPVALISHLGKKIAGKPVLEDVNLALLNGHVLGLLGPNGSGKTTLLRILAGLAHPSSGRVEIDGIVPGTETKGMVSYLPDTLFLGPEMTVESARKYFQTFFMDFDRERFDELAQRLNLPERTKVGRMSKGYRDRLAVALVMSRRARLYLLDEPLGGVDPVVRDEILDILVEALGDEATMLITTHQVRDLGRIFDEVCFLREGKVARYGVAEEIRNEEQADLDHVYRSIFG
ncbi:ABC transporter ATP-binding protein [Murdochiella sp. Marseille-P8839]|nr:ABC transporter ATP-binding protein [Murdochiella sp. Marseille-P8839]